LLDLGIDHLRFCLRAGSGHVHEIVGVDVCQGGPVSAYGGITPRLVEFLELLPVCVTALGIDSDGGYKGQQRCNDKLFHSILHVV
jgi:hypothetical protein